MIKLNRFFFATRLGFSNSHVWVKVDPEALVGKLGITHQAQKLLGDVSHIDLPPLGETFEFNQQMGRLESKNNIFKLFSPLNLQVKGINQEVLDDFTVINRSADTAWILEFTFKEEKELDDLLQEEEYKQLIDVDK